MRWVWGSRHGLLCLHSRRRLSPGVYTAMKLGPLSWWYEGGHTHIKAREKIQLQVVKQACGTRSSTPTASILAELQIRPLLDACWLRLIRFWNDNASAEDDDMYERILLDNLDRAFSGNANWSRELLLGALRIGFSTALQCCRACRSGSI